MVKEIAGNHINQEIGMETCGNSQEIYRQILTLMLSYEKEKEKGQALMDSYKNQDWKLFGNEVHALKSSASGIGAAKLSEAARDLEAAVDEGDLAFVEAHQEAFFRLLQETLLEIHSILNA